MTAPPATSHWRCVSRCCRPQPHATVAKDCGVWRWSCRYCECSDTRWLHRDAFLDALAHLRRHLTFGFGGSR